MDVADVCWLSRRYDDLRPLLDQALAVADALGEDAGERGDDARFLASLLEQLVGPG